MIHLHNNVSKRIKTRVTIFCFLYHLLCTCCCVGGVRIRSLGHHESSLSSPFYPVHRACIQDRFTFPGKWSRWSIIYIALECPQLPTTTCSTIYEVPSCGQPRVPSPRWWRSEGAKWALGTLEPPPSKTWSYWNE